MADDLSQRIMVDPSFLLSQEGFSWLQEDPAIANSLVISQALSDWIAGEAHDFDPSRLLAPEDVEVFQQLRPQMVDLTQNLASFSHRDVKLSPSAEEIREILVGQDQEIPGSLIWADEWAFLQAHSLLFSKLRHPLEAFRDAGAYILEVGRRHAHEMLERVIPKEHLPDEITSELWARGVIKWVVVGGAGIGGGTLGGIAGVAIGGPVGGVIAAPAVRWGARRAANAAVLAIDP